MSIYNLDYDILIKENLPVDKRKDIEISWLNALFVTIKQLHIDIFITYRTDVIARAKHNGQKIIAESILNDTFGVVSAPFIYIDNTGDDVTPITFYNKSEGLPAQYFWNESEGQPAKFIFNESEASRNNEFTVFVPAAVLAANGAAIIRAEVDKIRPYSTSFTIIGY